MGWNCRVGILLAISLSVAWATPSNVALGGTVTAGGDTVYGDPSVVVDGAFCDGCLWTVDSAYWFGTNPYLDIDFGSAVQIWAAIVQADINDAYMLQYRDPGGVYHDWWAVPINDIAGAGLSTRPNSNDNTQWQPLSTVVATGVRVFATAGDADYSVSEVQILGETPEPATLVLAGVGLLGLGIKARRRRTT